MKTPEKLKWLFGESIDVKEAVLTVAAIVIILSALSS
jgi:hypothetical protein